MLEHRRCAMNRPRLSSERVEHLPTALLRSRVTLAPTDSCPAGAVRVSGPSSTRISMADVNAVGVAAETAMESAKADWVAEMVEEWMPNKARLRTFFNGCGTRLHKNHVSVQRAVCPQNPSRAISSASFCWQPATMPLFARRIDGEGLCVLKFRPRPEGDEPGRSNK